MAEATLVVADLSHRTEIEQLMHALTLPRSAEFILEPALDYPGQQLAIDLWAATDEELATTVRTVRDALERRLGITARTSDELDRELQADRSA